MACSGVNFTINFYFNYYFLRCFIPVSPTTPALIVSLVESFFFSLPYIHMLFLPHDLLLWLEGVGSGFL
jgi:hypothetical protein